MYQRKIPIDYNCGLNVAMEVVGSKWKFCLLDEISKGAKRPKDLVNVVTGITKRVLQNQLKELEFHGLLGKTIYNEIPLKVEYFLTESGESLMPLIVALDKWGLAFAPQLQNILENQILETEEL
ncbi:HTH-type transcriptional activator HxlR [Flavobacterium bizetiae]|uniref:HTH-type transcriptional activator HxlR n=2 Tax=Flavobacterium bizetiae TaxID=2704140 RepID=A0A6J4G924_9FLAO|nr:helix-turn-helix domain-containing protein [Flavobacterium bizetiae]CAA9195264.1 HTH-type transcriptional activator HxlR [Flavobacterium bizetiae]CAD5343167.1 HTH-type transcriptional activator HxlR [Flavobacterium bizetiae]CAD5346671.1 HTH-type transcriptional activator HxlR [Flavobacterium bizetiae]